MAVVQKCSSDKSTGELTFRNISVIYYSITTPNLVSFVNDLCITELDPIFTDGPTDNDAQDTDTFPIQIDEEGDKILNSFITENEVRKCIKLLKNNITWIPVR